LNQTDNENHPECPADVWDDTSVILNQTECPAEVCDDTSVISSLTDNGNYSIVSEAESSFDEPVTVINGTSMELVNGSTRLPPLPTISVDPSVVANAAATAADERLHLALDIAMQIS
jgi:hypothetical protein